MLDELKNLTEEQKLQKINNLIASNKIPYRKGVVAIIQNKKHEYLLVQNNSFNYNEWKFPSGGQEPNETPLETVKREIKEEIGTDKFEVKKQSIIKNQHEWKPQDILKKLEQQNMFYRGQEQIQYLIEFNGEDYDINIDRNELRAYRWAKLENLKEYLIFPGQLDLALKTITTF
jgi:putative (di)nucleoside polyphosphate hydrolase